MELKKSLFTASLALGLLFSLTACGDSEETIKQSDTGIQEMTIKISHVVSENTPKQNGSLEMKKVIEEESDGKIKVQVYPNSQLFGDKEEYQNLIANNVQFIMPDMGKLVGVDEAFNIASMPFLFEDDDAANAFWDGEKGQEVFKRLEKDGVKGITSWPNGPKHITNNTREIKTPADLKGLKIRTQGGKLQEEIYQEWGAGSTSIPFGELYTALQQKTVDGQDNTFSNIESKKFDETQKYMTIIGHNRVEYPMLTNLEFWNSMNDETRAIVEKGIEAGTKVARESAEQLNEESLKKLKERGNIKITELTDAELEEFKKSLEPVYESWKEIIGADVIENAESQ